jgi:altronate hydrolase
MTKKVFKINPKDNVCVALQDLYEGEVISIEQKEITLKENINAYHKISLVDLKKGDTIIKYGASIGQLSKNVFSGHWIHEHNLTTGLSGKSNYTYSPENMDVSVSQFPPTFLGYRRNTGKVGIRNDIWIIPLVACVNKLASKLAEEFTKRNDTSGIEGCYAFPHPYGCSQLGDDHSRTQRILAGIARNPNAGGIFFIGLGCENNTWESFQNIYNPQNDDCYEIMIAQHVEDEVEEGLEKLKQLHQTIISNRRVECSISDLCVGLKCGGSDSLSGITANPLVGLVCDSVVASGGSCLMTEVPEMFGAETFLFNRCQDENIFNKSVQMINTFKEYYMLHKQPIYQNPSPGNIQGGITTLEEKSLGCIQKSGEVPVTDILTYGEIINNHGLNLVYGPGNDPVSVTNLVASGAQLILFTTGRGSPYGGPVPTIKISSNSKLAKVKKNWIDFDAGILMDGISLKDLSVQLIDFIRDVASGRIFTRSEVNNYREIAIFKDGVTL